MTRDTLDQARDPNFDLKSYLWNAYIHPMLKAGDDEDDISVADKLELDNVLVPTKRTSRRNTPVPSKYNGSSSPSLPDVIREDQLL